MFHLTLFGSAQAGLSATSTTLTVFGSTVLLAPTVAQRVLRLAHGVRPSRLDVLLGRNRSFMVTFFGSTEVSLPSLIDEWAALRHLAANAEMPRDRLRQLCDGLRAQESHGLDMATLTLFGSCEVSRPSVKREVAALERAEKAGTIDRPTRLTLESLVGRGEPAIIGGLADAALA